MLVGEYASIGEDEAILSSSHGGLPELTGHFGESLRRVSIFLSCMGKLASKGRYVTYMHGVVVTCPSKTRQATKKSDRLRLVGEQEAQVLAC